MAFFWLALAGPYSETIGLARQTSDFILGKIRSAQPGPPIVPLGERRYRNLMGKFKPILASWGVLAVLLVTACGSPEAYIYKAGEFNRQAKDFGKEPEKIDSVTICYNKFRTKPEIIANMASTECAKFNKKAEFKSQTLNTCPLFTPVAAVYSCTGG